MTDYGVVLVTASSLLEAQTIAQSIIEKKMAACVNFFPVQSVYSWQGKINHDAEYQLIIKTEFKLFNSLERTIKELHSYSEPEIILLNIVDGSKSYLSWLSESLHSNP
jgi:periplasmic divalent cation tolerance protein